MKGGVFGVVAQFASDDAYGGPQRANVGVGVKPSDPALQMLVVRLLPGVGRRRDIEVGERHAGD